MARYDDSSITVYEGLESIRNNMGMYLHASPELPAAQIQLIKEVFDNSIDEARVANRPDFTIDIYFFYNKKRYQVMIVDQGRGVPLGKLSVLFTKPHSSGKVDKADAYVASIGTHGIGAKATAAFSTNFVVLSKRDNKIGKLHIKNLNIKDCKINQWKDNNTGTIVFFEPDTKVFPNISEFLESEGFQQFIDLITFYDVQVENCNINVYKVSRLINIESKLSDFDSKKLWNDLYNFKNVISKTDSVVYQSKEDFTIIDFVRSKFHLKGDIIWDIPVIEKKLTFENIEDKVGYKVQLFLTENFIKQPCLLGSINGTPIHDLNSSHLSTTIKVLKEFIAKNIEDGDLRTFFTNVYKLPIAGVVLADFTKAKFLGQTKIAFHDKDFAVRYTTFLKKSLLKIHSSKWEDLYDIISEDIQEQYARYTNKIYLAKGLKNINLDLHNPDCYFGCRLSDNNVIELLITEGDSAGNFVAQVRDPNTQAVFKLRGKPKNLFKKNINENEVLEDLIKIIGVTPQDKDLSKMNFSKICILADADDNGYHITALLVGNLYKINPLILEEGRVHIANPPLYMIYAKNHACLFLRNFCALMDIMIETVYSKLIDIFLVNNKTKKEYKLEGEAYRDFCYYITHIGGLIDILSNKLALSPQMLEWMMHVIEYLHPVNTDKIKEILHFDKILYDKNTDTLTLMLYDRYFSIPHIQLLRKELINMTSSVDVRAFSWKDFAIRIHMKTGKDLFEEDYVSMTNLFNIFERLKKVYSIHRLKGLGEMTPDAIRITCVDPETRTYTTITSIGDVDRLYQLLGIDVKSRKELVI